MKMSPHFVLGRENVPCTTEVVNRSLKADCTDFTDFKKLEELESEFDNFDVDDSYPTSPFTGCNIMDLDFVCKQLLHGRVKLAKPCNP